MIIASIFLLCLYNCYCSTISDVVTEDEDITQIFSNPQPGQGTDLLRKIQKYNEILQSKLNLAKQGDKSALRFVTELKSRNGPKFLQVAVHIKSKVVRYQKIFNYTSEECYDFEDNVYWTRNLWGEVKDIGTLDCNTCNTDGCDACGK